MHAKVRVRTHARVSSASRCIRWSLATRARARAGKLAWGAFNTNYCPAGSYVITNVAQCQAAAATAGKPWLGSGSSVDDNLKPYGCFWYTAVYSGYVYSNRNTNGKATSLAQPLCAVPATGVYTRVME
jgi:hypothetical protein